MKETSLTRYAWISVGAAIITIGLKTGAWRLTGSVGLLSDAMESLVNLIGALMALAMLTVAARPEDEDHPHGHSKAEYFSSGVEGTLILIAAVSIGIAAFERLVNPKPLEQIGVGLAVSVSASLVNLFVAIVLLRAARKHNSITLEANAHHLLTDVWTSAGVLTGVVLVWMSGWVRLDPLMALAVAANIIWTGTRIIRRSIEGLMDKALPPEEKLQIEALLAKYDQEGLQYHALRTRQAGALRFVSVHILVPGNWTVHHGHQVLERIESEIRSALPNCTILTHLESLDDPTSWDDRFLKRAESKPPDPAP